MKKNNTVLETPKEYVMDFDKLKSLTGKSFVELAEELAVDKSFVTASKTSPKIMNRIIATYLDKFESVLPLKDFLVETKK